MKNLLSKEVVELGNKVFIRMAEADVIRPIVEDYQIEIINTNNLKNKSTGKLITNLFNTYQMSEEHFSLYLTECNKKAKENGFDIEINYCPLLIAETKQREAERKFITEICKMPQVNINIDDLLLSLKNYKKVLDLSLEMVSSYETIN